MHPTIYCRLDVKQEKWDLLLPTTAGKYCDDRIYLILAQVLAQVLAQALKDVCIGAACITE
jgi:hypothetical protein